MTERDRSARIRPFEICSIRPPTENASLTFRLTRNCYWNRCAFCPVYKLGSRFSRRGIDEIRGDVIRAKRIDELLFEHGIGCTAVTEADLIRADAIASEIETACGVDEPVAEHVSVGEHHGDLDPRMRWFLPWFNSTPGLAECMRHILIWRMAGGTTCFLGDADSLILKPDFFHRVMELIRVSFPGLIRFTVYGRTATAARLRSVRDLREFARAGLSRVHFGIESGSDRVLSMMGKGATSEDHRIGCGKTKEAGLSCSVYVMPGLGGAVHSREHASETAALISSIAPDYVRLRTLEIFPWTILAKMAQSGEFIPPDEETVVREIRTMIQEIDTETEIVSDSASNLLNVNGRLPHDRERMLAVCDAYLELTPRAKLEFSLSSRLQSLYGQYGGIPNTIHMLLSDYLIENRLDVSLMTDEFMRIVIEKIRQLLMP